MRFVTITLTLFLFVQSCVDKKTAQSNQTPEPTEPIEKLNNQMTSFSEIDTSGILMFPLSMGESSRSGSSLVYKDMPYSNYWNILFHNTRTNDSYLLSDRKMLIRESGRSYGNSEDPLWSKNAKYLFYKVVTDDMNNDKVLNDKDPDYLFITDIDGRNFRQISPKFYNIESWQLIRASNKVLILAKNDRDKNGFDEEDEISTFEFHLKTDSLPRELFSDSLKRSLKVLFDRDWKRLNQQR